MDGRKRLLAGIVLALVGGGVVAGAPAMAGGRHPAAPGSGPGTVSITQQRGWLVQFGESGDVQTYENLQLLEGTALYYLNLITPNVVSGQGYYLATVTICYDAEAKGSEIRVTHVLRSSNGNFVDIDFIDETNHHVVYPKTECYDESVQDTNAPSVSTYTVQLVIDGGIRPIRVTASYAPRGTVPASSRNVSVRLGRGGSGGSSGSP